MLRDFPLLSHSQWPVHEHVHPQIINIVQPVVCLWLVLLRGQLILRMPMKVIISQVRHGMGSNSSRNSYLELQSEARRWDQLLPRASLQSLYV